jgi:DNA-binding MarR family transcriptional regulator
MKETAMSANNDDFELDAVLHQPLRTQVVAYLAGRGTATFTELKKVVNASDGNLESHLKKLIAADYVVTSKDTSSARPQTLYALTAEGRTALKLYLERLERLLSFARQGQAEDNDIPADLQHRPAF